jgi:hypothetical protein
MKTALFSILVVPFAFCQDTVSVGIVAFYWTEEIAQW